MNEAARPLNPDAPSGTVGLHAPDVLEARTARRLASCLDEAARSLPPGVETRLAFARTQALARARARQREAAAPTAVVAPGAAARLGGGPTWWRRLGVWLPLLLVVAGLWTIGQLRERERVRAAAELDARLLTDVLPPAAYADPGFLAFLRQTEGR